MSRGQGRSGIGEVSLGPELCDPAAEMGRTILRMGLVGGALMLPALWSAVACSPVVREFAGAGGSGGAGGSSSSGEASTSTGTSGTCKPGATVPCYSGPASTEGVGICKHGTAKCGTDGKPGTCSGEVLPATTVDCTLHEDQDCDGKVDRCSLDYLWANTYGISGDNNVLQGLGANADGTVLVCGTMNGQIDLGKGPLTVAADDNDAFAAMLDAQGKTLWQHQYGDSSDQECDGAGVDLQGNGYIAGIYQGGMTLSPLVLPTSVGGSDVYVAKLDASGAALWARTGGDVNQQHLDALAATPAGGVVVAGHYNGSFSFNGGGTQFPGSDPVQNVYVQRFDADGNAVFGVASVDGMGGTSGYPEVHGVTIDASDDVIVTGYFTGTVGLGGAMYASQGDNDIFVMKLQGSTGQTLWVRTFGGTGDDVPYGVATNQAGDVLVSGYFMQSMPVGSTTLTSTGTGLFLAALDKDGTVSWANAYGDGGFFDFMEVHVDDAGDIVLTGVFDGTVTFGGDTFDATQMGQDTGTAFVAKLDATGKHLASRAFYPAVPSGDAGANGTFLTAGVVVTTVPKTNAIVIGGISYDTTDFGGGPIGVTTASSPFVAEYAP